MESPQLEIVGDPTDTGRKSLLSQRADLHFERLWADDRTRFLKPSSSGDLIYVGSVDELTCSNTHLSTS